MNALLARGATRVIRIRLVLATVLVVHGVHGLQAAAPVVPARSADDPTAAVRELVQRLLPAHADKFHVERIPADPAGDVFEIESRDGRIVLRGNNGVAAASALNWYLKYHCQAHHTFTGGSRLRLPDPLPEVKPAVRRISSTRHRYFLNYCCFGYSLPWFDWAQWESLVDWMALQGVNLPLSVTGQEGVWQAVGRRLGLTDADLAEFLAGPPYLPFGWMGCLDGHGGPLPPSWIEAHVELGRKILERQRALGMRPVLQGFTGHVPPAVARKFPEARLQKIRWVEWDTFVLDPLDPLFPKIAKVFLEEQTRLFGTDHYYAADTFIEMTPPSGDTRYLADIGRAIHQGLHSTDPEAVWVLQGWPFFFARQFWTQPRIEAVLGAVPDDRLLLLDLFCEKTPVWKLTRAFCGKPWVWCNIQNFGNRVWLGGALDLVNRDWFDARKDPRSGRLVGLGFVNEGLDWNPVVYDLLFELAWRSEPVNLASWLSDYARRAYGRTNAEASRAWEDLHATAYQAAHDNASVLTAAPSLAAFPSAPYDERRLARAWQHLLAAAEELGEADPYRFDLVNVGRQALANHAARLHREIVAAYEAKDRSRLRATGERFVDLLGDLDGLLATREEFRLDRWLEDARRWGTTEADRDRLEWNARRVLTLWGNTPALRDYASRQWSGMLKGFYAARWKMFLARLDAALAEGKPFDPEAFAAAMLEFENRWAASKDREPGTTADDPIAASRRLWARYGDSLGAPPATQNRLP